MERLVLKRGDDGVFHLGGESGFLASLLCLWLSRYLLVKRVTISPAPAHDRPLTDVPEKLRLPKEQVLLVPLGQGLWSCLFI